MVVVDRDGGGTVGGDVQLVLTQFAVVAARTCTTEGVQRVQASAPVEARSAAAVIHALCAQGTLPARGTLAGEAQGRERVRNTEST